MSRGATAYQMADWLCQITGETAGVITIPRDGWEAADLLRAQVEARRPVMVITRDTWEFIEPRYGLIKRFAYEVLAVSPGGLIRLYCHLNRVEAHPKPVPLRDFLDLFRPEAATVHPPKPYIRRADQTEPGGLAIGDPNQPPPIEGGDCGIRPRRHDPRSAADES